MSFYFPNHHKTLSRIILIVFAYVIISQSSLSIKISKVISFPSLSQLTLAQKSIITANNNEKQQKDNNTVTEASGNFTNNQIKYRVITWIEDGSWALKIKGLHDNTGYNSNNETNTNATAIFNASFTMIKPNGSFSHTHLINNFTSNSVVFTGQDIIVKGIADIHSTIGLEFKHVPITVHLIGKKVLKLLIDVGKTNGHFAGPNEIHGTVIRGIGLDNFNTIKTNIASKNFT